MFRRFILSVAALLIALPHSQNVSARGGPAPSITTEPPRQIVDLSTGWRFKFVADDAGIIMPGYDDSAWEQVSVPHTWNRIGEYALTRGAATNNKQGIGWYRLNFNAPAAAKGRRHYLDFAAVAIIADVWVNGTHVGQHKGAFSRFRFDVTAAWKPGAANLIVVKADNSKPAPGSSTADVLPLAGDFFIHGGIYRGVSLITANDVGIDLLDFGGPGVYVTTGHVDPTNDTVSGTSVSVSVATKLRNSSQSRRKLKIVTTISGEEAPILKECMTCVVYEDPGPPTFLVARTWSSNSRIVLTPSAVTDVRSAVKIDRPILWGVGLQPTQYLVTVVVLDGKTVIDSVSQSFGIRSFKFDPNTGFSLNGQPLKLHGVSRHQDRLGQGYALTRADHKQDMDLIAEMGANSVRMAHYQHDDAWADEADAHGMVAWAEIPYVTTPSLSGSEGSAAVFANAEQQLRELIRQNYNHPSIMMWSIGNEVDASKLFGLGGGETKPLALLEHLQKVARQEDPTRPTIFADCCEDVRSPVAGLDAQVQGEALAGAADMIGYNRYYGWYYPQPQKAAEQLAAQMDKFHVKHPTLPIAISEYGAGGAIGQHSDNPTAGFVNATGRPQPEEYESWVHEQSWPVIRDRNYIWGSFVWNMFDFASDLRNEGDSVDINTKGLVSFDRKTKKDAFYYYKAQWNPEPLIWLTGKRYVDRAYPVMDVRAYSSSDEAVLMVNGKIYGAANCPDHVCVWPGVALRPGPNEISATNSNGKVMISDKTIWNGPDTAMGIRIDTGDIMGRLLESHCERSAAPKSPKPNSVNCRAALTMTGKGTRRFGSDNFVTGGTPAILNPRGFGGRGPALRTIAAPDPALYDYWREGEAFSYAIPVPDGTWTVTIHTFEPRANANAMMGISVGGKIVVPAFNVQKAAGGSLKGLAKSFVVTVKGGVLKLDFAAQNGLAVVAAIEVTK
jgi:beta-galactosidase